MSDDLVAEAVETVLAREAAEAEERAETEERGEVGPARGWRPAPTTQELLVQVMQIVQGVGKKQANQQQGYWFRGIDAVMNAVGPAFRDVGLVCIPKVLKHTEERFVTTNNKAMKAVTVTVEYTLYGPDPHDRIIGVSVGEAADSGDKATPKAMSVAYRSFLLQALCIPTHEPDPDATSYERSVSSPPDRTDPVLLSQLRERIDRVTGRQDGLTVWNEIIALFGMGRLALADRVDLRERLSSQVEHVTHETSQEGR